MGVTVEVISLPTDYVQYSIQIFDTATYITVRIVPWKH